MRIFSGILILSVSSATPVFAGDGEADQKEISISTSELTTTQTLTVAQQAPSIDDCGPDRSSNVKFGFANVVRLSEDIADGTENTPNATGRNEGSLSGLLKGFLRDIPSEASQKVLRDRVDEICRD